MFAEQMNLRVVYFSQWNQPELSGVISDVGNVYPRLADDYSSTCDQIPGGEFTNAVWGLSGDDITTHFRVYMKGSQQCHDVNAVWFLSAANGSKLVQCNVIQQSNADLLVCNIQCQCPCGVKCSYLQLSMQFPPWMKKTLALCSYEQLLQHQILWLFMSRLRSY